MIKAEQMKLSYVNSEALVALKFFCKLKWCSTIFQPDATLMHRFRGGNSHQKLEISNTNTQMTSKTEVKIVKMSDDPPLMSGKLCISHDTSFQLNQNWTVRPKISLYIAE